MRRTRRHVEACMPRAMKFRVNLREVSNVVFTCPVTCLSKHLRNFLLWPKFSSAQSLSILIRNRKNTRHSKFLICQSKWHLFVIKELFVPGRILFVLSFTVLVVLFLVTWTHFWAWRPKTRTTGQRSTLLIKSWLWTLVFDVGYHNPPTLRRAVLCSDTKCNSPA